MNSTDLIRQVADEELPVAEKTRHYTLFEGAVKRYPGLTLLVQSSGDPIALGSARALELIDRLERLDPDHSGLEALRIQALIAEGGRLQVAGRPEEAELLFRAALGSEAAGADAMLGLAKTLMESGRVNTAISVLSDALLRYPEDHRAHWEQLAAGGLEVWQVSGGHRSMMHTPHVQALADALTPHLPTAARRRAAP